jgi:ATP-dependent RNA helicase SUPV3L1/SUV3
LSAFGLRAIGKVAAGVEMLESLAERQAAGKGVLSEADLAALGVSLDEAKILSAALKASRSQKPDRDERPKVVKDSPFAALSALTAKPAPTRAKRKRPRRTRAPG